VLTRARHPGVVELRSVRDDGDEVVVVTSLPGAVELCQVPLSVEEVAGVLAVVATTVADLHDIGIAHGSIGPDAVVVIADGHPILDDFTAAGFLTGPPARWPRHELARADDEALGVLGDRLVSACGSIDVERALDAPRVVRSWAPSPRRAGGRRRRIEGTAATVAHWASLARQGKATARQVAEAMAVGASGAVLPRIVLRPAQGLVGSAHADVDAERSADVATDVDDATLRTVADADADADDAALRTVIDERTDGWAAEAPQAGATSEAPWSAPASMPESRSGPAPAPVTGVDPAARSATGTGATGAGAGVMAAAARGATAWRHRRRLLVGALLVTTLIVVALAFGHSPHRGAGTQGVAALILGHSTRPPASVHPPGRGTPAPATRARQAPSSSGPSSMAPSAPGDAPPGVACTPVRGGPPDPRCSRAMSFDAGVLSVGSARFALGEPGDVVVTGRWQCRAVATVALLRPTNGQIWTFGSWPAAGTPEIATLVGSVPGGRTLEARPIGSCDALVVGRSDGSVVVVQPGDHRYGP